MKNILLSLILGLALSACATKDTNTQRDAMEASRDGAVQDLNHFNFKNETIRHKSFN